VLAALALLSPAWPAGAADAAVWADTNFVAEVRRETEWLAGVPTRAVGTPSHDAVLDQLAARLRAIPGLRLWTDAFSTVVPTTQTAYLEIPDGPRAGRRRVYPLWPALARLNSTPADGIEADLVYVGEGRLTEIPAHRVRGQIAVMEMTGGGRWRDVYNAGAAALLMLGSETVSQYDAHAHLLSVPVNVPRFYVPPGEWADALRAGTVPRGRLFAHGRWTPAEARNVYALLAPTNAAERLPALTFVAATDSTGVVPDLAPGADAALDAAFLLALARRLAANPPPRPVLFAFLDAQALNQLGVRQLLGSCAVLPADRAAYLKEDRELLEEYRAAEDLAGQIGATPAALDTLHERRLRPLHRYVKDAVARDVVGIEDELGRLRLRARQARGGEAAPLQAAIARLAETRGRLNTAQVMLLTDRAISPDAAPLARDLWNRARDRIERQRRELTAVFAAHAAADRLRRDLLLAIGLPAADDASPLGFLLGLDLSDAGVAAGPALLCHHGYANETANASELRTWLTETADREADTLWPTPLRPAVNLTPFSGLDSVASHSVGRQPTLTAPAASFRVPGMTWATLDGFRMRADTPNDRADRLDWSRLAPQIEVTRRLLERLARRTDFRPRRPTGRSDAWRGVRGAIVERSVGEPVPRLPMEGYLTTLICGMAAPGRAVPLTQPPVVGVRWEEFALTGADGRFRFEALPSLIGNGPNPNVGWALRKRLVQAYLTREDGALARAVDMNKAGKGVRLEADLSRPIEPLRAVVFTGEEFSLVGLTDPRFLSAPSPWTSVLLDAARGGKPQRANLAIHQDTLAAVLEPGTRWMLALRQGATQNRMALLNMTGGDASRGPSAREAMRGFEIGHRLDSLNEHVAARDLAALNDHRLGDYARAGIRSEAIEALRAKSRDLLARAEDALRRGDARALYTHAMGALAHEGRAYQAVRDLANDVVHAAIFLLLALVPFAFAFERLAFACSHVYRQLLAVLLIFAAMTAILWSFHPAFRISNQPLIILMAFAILFMSLMVMSVVYARFKSGLDETRRGKAETSGARASGGGVLMSAAILGLANMRKRKLRTALTGATVVLVTFALLCFSSINAYTDRKEFKVNARSPYTGLLLRLPASRPLPGPVLPYLSALYGEDATVPSYWWVDAYDRQWRLHARNPLTGAQVSLKAALGLSPGEAALTGVDRVLPNWDRFAAGEGGYLAASTARDLGLKPGDEFLVAGRSFRLLDVYDAATLAAEIKCLDGLSLLPYDYSALDDEQRRNLASTEFSVLSSHLENAASMEPGADLPTVQGNELAILPAKELSAIGRGASVRAIGLRTESFRQARERAMDIADRMAVPVYFGSPEEVGVVAATPLRPMAPRGLILPIAIAGLIVFNTLLSSIAERKREIHVYTSLGLAPIHVGVLFLAEAVTYGLMGSIFGYVVGQGAATLLSRLNWLGGITLNYSGTQAVATMAIVQGIVILSAIVPAIVAGRIASPSREMNWSVPPPDRDTIRDLLPFTVTRAAADGAMCFLREYLDAHREGSIGHFSTDALRLERAGGAGADLLALRATVWLAPYDLGVRQEAEIRVRPTEAPDVCEIEVELRRGAGQTRSWWKLNRVFLGDLRRQLLGWRKLSRDRVLAYIAEGRAL
jgi:hypothetical protein